MCSCSTTTSIWSPSPSPASPGSRRTRACQAERLLSFLKEHESEYLFLVGDIVDFWAMGRRGVYWTSAMNTFAQKVLKRARAGVKVIFVPGNHDEALRDYVDSTFGNIRLHLDYEHVAADGAASRKAARSRAPGRRSCDRPGWPATCGTW